MTRKEAIEKIKMILAECAEDEDAVCYVTFDDADALDMAIKALEQEPCEDAVNRQAVCEFLENHAKTYDDVRVRIGLKAGSSLVANPDNVPSVTPARKKGKWLNRNTSGYRFYGKCSECGEELCMDIMDTDGMKYCPYCGAKMDEETEG